MFGGVGKSGSPISRCTMLRPCASSLRALASTSKAVSVPISSMRRANFTASSSDSKGTEVAFEGYPLHPDVRDPRHARPLTKQVEEPLQCGRAAFRLYLHGAIVAVAHIPLYSEPAGMRCGKGPKAERGDVADD